MTLWDCNLYPNVTLVNHNDKIAIWKSDSASIEFFSMNPLINLKINSFSIFLELLLHLMNEELTKSLGFFIIHINYILYKT